jgi:threonylcarbamoyladenosine tRNA methylthiotransferase MtaB
MLPGVILLHQNTEFPYLCGMPAKRIAFQTFGCKLNFAESSTLSRDLSARAYEIVDYHHDADVYVINSCLVTAQAEKKCRAAIRQAKKRNPEALVAVIGCFSQLRGQELAAMEEVDLVLGNDEKFKLHHFLHEAGKLPGTLRKVGDISRSMVYAPSWSTGDRTRSFLKIQDGCDYYCTYCTIPYARGRSRSATIAGTIATAHEIAAAGMKELVLTGVNIGDFGKPHGESFFDLMMELDKVAGIARIRISSIEPDLLSDEMIAFVASSGRFLPHFHIPLQSGSDKVLDHMKRKYRREVFAGRTRLIKKLMPRACIAADVIVGFPGETEKDFMDTWHFLDALPVSYMHVFTYSERPGTKAATLTPKVSASDKRDRSRRLHGLSERKKELFYQENRGRMARVLFESDNTGGYMHGFTENYIRVRTPYDPALVNCIVELRLGTPDESGNFVYKPKTAEDGP